MNCNCKPELQSCENCDYIVNTDCVEYKGDRLNVEPSTVRDGSSRTLSSLIELFDGKCPDRESKTIQGDYTIIEGDEDKILLLDGDIPTADDYNYVITLPDSEYFYNKVLIIKDISEGGSPTGEVFWDFNESITYDYKLGLDSTSFKTLANSQDKTLILTFIKVGVNYEWVVLSSGTNHRIEVNELEDSDLSNSWVNQSTFTFRYIKEGKKVTLDGVLVSGTSANVVTLPAGYRPVQNMVFIVAYTATPWFAIVNVLTSGLVQISIPGVALPTSDDVHIQNISFYTE